MPIAPDWSNENDAFISIPQPQHESSSSVAYKITLSRVALVTFAALIVLLTFGRKSVQKTTYDVKSSLEAFGAYNSTFTIKLDGKKGIEAYDGLRKVGSAVHLFTVQADEIKGFNATDATTLFNPAFMPMPPDSPWPYIVVARLHKTRKDVQLTVETKLEPLQLLIAGFGCRITPEGIERISNVHVFQFDAGLNANCSSSEHTFGVEDGRPFWSRNGSIRMLMTRTALDSRLCRNLALVDDLTAHWPDLAHVVDTLPRSQRAKTRRSNRVSDLYLEQGPQN